MLTSKPFDTYKSPYTANEWFNGPVPIANLSLNEPVVAWIPQLNVELSVAVKFWTFRLSTLLLETLISDAVIVLAVKVERVVLSITFN